MSAGLDTSVVLRLLTGEPAAQAARAYAELQQRLQRDTTVFVSDLVVSETYFALQYHYGLTKAAALKSLALFLTESGVASSGAAAALLHVPGLATVKPCFVDRLIHADCMLHAAEMLTFERDARRLPGVLVLTV